MAVVVNHHNMLRRKVANGEEIRGTDTSITEPQYSATNMNALVWDEELATVAQRYQGSLFYCFMFYSLLTTSLHNSHV